MSIGVVGDLHWKDNLGYAEYIKDRRKAEKEQVLDKIVKSLSGCDTIVFMGDQFNARNNTSQTIREFIAFLRRFDGKEIYMLAGNHEISGDGKTALDFITEVGNKKWHIISNSIESVALGPIKIVLCPYLGKSALGVTNEKDGMTKLMKSLPKGDILFIHHAISDTPVNAVTNTNFFREIVLPRKELMKKYKHIFGGHIHAPSNDKGIYIVGSVFTNEVGEIGKFIYTIEDVKIGTVVHQHKLPGRSIIKLENPEVEDIVSLRKDTIAKVLLTKKISKEKMEKLKEKLATLDAYILLENYPTERKKLDLDGSMLEFNIDSLLEVYAKVKKIDIATLKRGFELIK
jgi:DNA repair exonuclease SbcCD nuclease subunit